MKASIMPATVKMPPTIAHTLVKKCRKDILVSWYLTCTHQPQSSHTHVCMQNIRRTCTCSNYQRSSDVPSRFCSYGAYHSLLSSCVLQQVTITGKVVITLNHTMRGDCCDSIHQAEASDTCILSCVGLQQEDRP